MGSDALAWMQSTPGATVAARLRLTAEELAQPKGKQFRQTN